MSVVADHFRGKQVALLAIGKIMAIAAQIGVPMFLARALTKNDYGVYCQFNMFEGLFAATLNLTLASGIYYFFPRIQQEKLRSVFGNAFLIFFIMCVLGFFVLQFTPLGNAVMGTGEVRSILLYVMLAAFCMMCAGIIEPLYVVSADTLTSLYYPTAIVALRLVTIIPATILLGGIRGVVVGILISQGVIFLFSLWYVFRRGGKGKWIDFELMKTQLAYALPFACSGFLGTISSKFDKIICSSNMTAADYAVYTIAVLAIPGVEQVYASISEVSLTGMSKCFKANDYKGALELLKNFEEKAISFSCPLVFGAALYADHIVKLIYSDKYVDAIPYFRLFQFALLFEVLASGLIVRASGRTRISMYTGIIAAVVTLPTTYFAIRYGGILGGVLSVMFGRILQRILYSFYEIRIVHSCWKDYLPWKSIGKVFAISILFFLPFGVLYHYINFNFLISAALGGIYVLAVYAFELHLGVFIVSKEKLLNFLVGHRLLKRG